MVGAFVPWYMSRTAMATIRCPWTGREVEVRYLTCGGSPIGLIGCSDRDCSMPCLSGAPPPDAAEEPAAPREFAEDRVAGRP
jgi:hypothetical protein